MIVLLMGIAMLGVGLWEIIGTRKTFNQLKTGKLTTNNGFMPFALWLSFAIGVLLTLSGITCFVFGFSQMFIR
ncbi:hypothetical protein [Lacticaseibacillus sp. 53-4]|uniref:hypothetical protein n=1 Tax=Lacticaseibacillus sp. 53-4 TaxID=2799575 RepID=UPI001942B661|nr:hypothetical protein [Lacticaseibacillus sp. 53-4]